MKKSMLESEEARLGIMFVCIYGVKVTGFYRRIPPIHTHTLSRTHILSYTLALPPFISPLHFTPQKHHD
jgi:hypothetical protein